MKEYFQPRYVKSLCDIMEDIMNLQQIEQKTGLTKSVIATYYKKCIHEEGTIIDWSEEITNQDVELLLTIRQLRLVNFGFEEIREMLSENKVRETIQEKIKEYTEEPRNHRYELELLKTLLFTGIGIPGGTDSHELTIQEDGPKRNEKEQVMILRRLIRKRQKQDYGIHQDYLYFAVFNLLVLLGVFLYEMITVIAYGLDWNLYFGVHYWVVLLGLEVIVNGYGIYCRKKRIDELHHKIFHRERSNKEACVELGGNFCTYAFLAVVCKILLNHLQSEMAGGGLFFGMVGSILLLLAALGCLVFFAVYPFYQVTRLRYEFIS